MQEQIAFSAAFKKVDEVFPFKNYLDQMCYYEMHSIVTALKKMIPVFAGRRLLDIGAGPMDKTGILKTLGFDCSATDDLSDPWHLRNNNASLIKDYARQIGITFYHQKENNYEIPFQKNSFDVVCALSVIEHLHESPREFLNVMGEFAKTNGYILVEMPNSVNLRKRISVCFGKTNYNPVGELFYSTSSYRGHVREYTLAETIFILQQSGFTIRHSSTFEHIAYKKLSAPLKQLYLALGHLVPTFRSGILVIAQKPEGWKPAIRDEEKYRMAISGAVPKGVA